MKALLQIQNCACGFREICPRKAFISQKDQRETGN